MITADGITRNEENELLERLKEIERQRRQILDELEDKRRARANEIRRLYFKERKTQKEIALYYGMWQGSISRIISEQTWENKRYW